MDRRGLCSAPNGTEATLGYSGMPGAAERGKFPSNAMTVNRVHERLACRT